MLEVEVVIVWNLDLLRPGELSADDCGVHKDQFDFTFTQINRELFCVSKSQSKGHSKTITILHVQVGNVFSMKLL